MQVIVKRPQPQSKKSSDDKTGLEGEKLARVIPADQSFNALKQLTLSRLEELFSAPKAARAKAS